MVAQMLLRDADIFPLDKILEEALGKNIHNVLLSFLEAVTNKEYGLVIEWRYYNDGKAWLGKAIYKKKTIFWLSAWEGFFKTSVFFTEKHLEAIAELAISETIKDEFAKAKTIGKLIPMIFDVNEENQLDDLLTVVQCKKSLK